MNVKGSKGGIYLWGSNAFITDLDFIVLFNLITVEAINIKHLSRKCVFSVEMITSKRTRMCLIMSALHSFTFLLLLCFVMYTIVEGNKWEIRNTACVHPNKMYKYEMPCLKMTLRHMGGWVVLPFMSQKLQENKDSSLKHRCHFLLLCPPSVRVCGGNSTQSHLWGRFNTHPAFQKSHRPCFHTFPITVKQKIEKIVSKTSELPNLWSWTVAGLRKQRWGVMVKHAAWSLHSSGTPKKHRRPKGVWWHTKVSVFPRSPFLSSRK